ncbi:hypothetical protein GRI39_02110 [Altererythrobacter indicus]|uniref:Uncharacterized protein n=1 Tax=Altericroceibacterium indicum TaxID=374177 RepID=A0A845A720_9SPHN|nr:hypothetical protein [Altericroceibacterium indicum]MXP24841.1 hypothetical protein [Altericroceibacterium indicum]
MIPAIYALAVFSSSVIADPITQDKLAVFIAGENGSSLALKCTPGEGDLEIVFMPRRYYSNDLWLLQRRAESRFSIQSKPDRGQWQYSKTYIIWAGMPFNQRKAEFLDNLARSNAFHIRYEPSRYENETFSMSYHIDTGELQNFISKCNPARVIEYLQKMGSPAAPKGSAE